MFGPSRERKDRPRNCIPEYRETHVKVYIKETTTKLWSEASTFTKMSRKLHKDILTLLINGCVQLAYPVHCKAKSHDLPTCSGAAKLGYNNTSHWTGSDCEGEDITI